VGLRCGVEEDTTGQSECDITKNGGYALELWVPAVEYTSAERRAVFGNGLVAIDESANLGRRGIIEEDGREIRGDFIDSGEVCSKETKERALVLLVTNNKGHLGELSGLRQYVG